MRGTRFRRKRTFEAKAVNASVRRTSSSGRTRAISSSSRCRSAQSSTTFRIVAFG